MPGIFGCIDRKGDPLPRQMIIAMVNSLKHGNQYVDVCAMKSILLGEVQARSSYNQKGHCICKYGSLMGVFSGRITNKLELSRKFGVSNDSDTRFILELYIRCKLKFANYLNGLFLAGIYDEDKKTFVIVNDRYGFYPIFYALNSKRFIFSSEIKAILKDPLITPKINKNAITEFFTLSQLLGKKTFFQNVKLIPPATYLVYNNTEHQVSLKQYWDFAVKQHDQTDSIDYHLRNFRKLMQKAVERSVQDKEKVGIFLSAGIDSRILTAFASETNTDIITFTFGINKCRQQKIAKKVAERLGVENIFFEIPSDFIADYANDIVYKGDGLVRIRDCSFIPFLEEIRKEVDTALLGTFGGQLFGQDLRKNIIDVKSKEEMINCLLKIYTSSLPIEEYEKAFTDVFYSKIKGNIVKNLKKTLEKIDLTSPVDVFQYWEHRNREHRYIFQCCRRYIDWYLETRHPFLDNDLVNFFALRLPPYLRFNQKFYQKALNYCFPTLSDIPLERTGAPPDSSQTRQFFGKVNLFLEYRVRRITERLSKGRVLLSPLDYRERYSTWLRTTAKTYISSILLDPKTLKRGFFRENYIRRIVDEHMKAKKNHELLLCDLVNFELMNRIFFD